MKLEKSSRMDTSELKAQLLKRVGAERFKKYFFCLNRFLNQKLSKSDFDKSCYRILGRENLSLHNQMIRTILKNACSAKNPPPSLHEAGLTKSGIESLKSLPVLEDGHVRPAVVGPNQISVGPFLSNGIAPISPRKPRSGVRERKLREKPHSLGSNGNYSIATNDNGMKITENEELVKKSLDVPCVDQDKDQSAPMVEDGEEVEQANLLKVFKSPLLAPLGIPYCSASTGKAHKSLPLMEIGSYVSCYDIAGLSDSDILRRRMEQIACVQGLEGVTLECANTLNNMLDVYLKRLIGSCLEFVGARSNSDTSMYAVQNKQSYGKHINGVWPSNYRHMQSGGPSNVEEHRVHRSVSLLDFKVAMELNPQLLGEDWPLLLEKISMQAFEE